MSHPGLQERLKNIVVRLYGSFAALVRRNIVSSTPPTMWRHGDVFIAEVSAIPVGVRQLPHCVLAEGELTGHSHRICESGTATLFDHPSGDRFLRVDAPMATLIHQEHKQIVLPQGNYRVWIQREYTPQNIRRVFD